MEVAVSYTSAGIFPLKVLKYPVMENGRIKPIHLQFCPTNHCDLNCHFCSCSNRSKKDEFEWDRFPDLVELFIDLGCKSVTITGGGEPLRHPYINSMINLFCEAGIKIALVTNGTHLGRLSLASFASITWLRMSFSDDRDLSLLPSIEPLVKRHSLDWSFSYVVTDKVQLKKVFEIISFANNNNFTHVRFVPDLLNLFHSTKMSYLKRKIKLQRINDDKVIYQGRQKFEKGARDCWISLLKPVVSATGKLYPCCGVQYALQKPSRDFEDQMCMGGFGNMGSLYQNQIPFDGSHCVKCYYGNYNQILSAMKLKLDHLEFV